MLKLDKTGKYFKGELNYEKEFLIKDRSGNNTQVEITHIFSFHEKGMYFDWGMSACGFGQYSMSLSDKGWYIDNECMSLHSCQMFLETLEEAIVEQNNSKLMYQLNKLKYNLSPECSSLAEGLTLIWKEATKDERDSEEKEIVFQYNDLMVKHFFLDEEERKGNPKRNVGKRHDLSFTLCFDMKWKQFGKCYLSVVTPLEKQEDMSPKYCISENLKEDTLVSIVEHIEELNVNVAALEMRYSKAQYQQIKELVKVWNEFKEKGGLKTKEDFIKHFYHEECGIASGSFARIR